jgi:hypothetical protein
VEFLRSLPDKCKVLLVRSDTGEVFGLGLNQRAVAGSAQDLTESGSMVL